MGVGGGGGGDVGQRGLCVGVGIETSADFGCLDRGFSINEGNN